jgi:tetratricopeptide (TPR) repeat protein
VARQIPELIAASREVEQMWTEHRREMRAGMVHIQSRSTPLYESTRLLRAYESNVVPGILQTRGYIYRHLGDRDQASTCCRHALDLFRQAGDLYSEATCLTYLGDTHRDAGDLDAAHQAWLQAEAILHRLNHPDVERVRRKSRSHTG